MAQTVFISSTSKDLQAYRKLAADAARECGFAVSMCEDWSPEGVESVASCLKKAREADFVVAIVAHRYGWVPPDSNPDFKSITWMECEAVGLAKVLPFIVDPACKWPEKHYEAYRLTEEGPGLASRKLAFLQKELARNGKKLGEFKAWLGSKLRVEFKGKADFKVKVTRALKGRTGDPPSYNTEKYFAELRHETGEIDLERLHVPREGNRRPEMDALYIPLRTHSSVGEPGAGRGEMAEVALEISLRDNRKLLLVGEAGSGKTTFLRRIAWELCEGKPNRETPRRKLELPGTGFPMFIRVSGLDKFIHESKPCGKAPDDPLWLAAYLASQRGAKAGGLDEAFFEAKLNQADSWLLLDGLDEAADEQRRRHIVALVAKASAHGCRYVVSTRPPADPSDAVLPGFVRREVEPLDDAGIGNFLKIWCEWLPRDDAYREGLEADVRRTPKSLRSNPFMLTALAVVYLQDKRLPHQRAELYEAIVDWLSVQAEERWGEPSYPRHLILSRLQRLALAMQQWKGGRITVVSVSEAAPVIMDDQFRSGIAEARRFLERARDASGLLTPRGDLDHLAFWHKIFLEYLAARELVGLYEERTELAKDLLYRTEGREMLPLAAVRMKTEYAYLPKLFGALIADALPRELKEQAHAAGVIGSMWRDLKSTGWQLPAATQAEFEKLLESVKAVFDRELQKGIPMQSRVEAAEALGAAGDDRLQTPDEEDYWVPVAGKGKKIPGFDIGRFPVTVFEYARYLDAKDGARRPEDWESQEALLSRPVVGVMWYDAMEYCEWWSERTKRKITLPSDEQWEWAARGPEGREYPWGAQEPTPERANYLDTGLRRAPTPVGLFPEGNTPAGVSDMAGNVWEWTRSVYDPKKYGEDGKSVRGGSFNVGYSESLRAAFRLYFPAGNRGTFNGFRCVRE